MNKKLGHLLCQTDWKAHKISTGTYFNKRPLDGFIPKDGPWQNPLHPADSSVNIESVISTHINQTRKKWPEGIYARLHCTLPVLNPSLFPKPTFYQWIDAPRSLSSVSISILLFPRHKITHSSLRFCFNHKKLPSLVERITEDPFEGIVGNLGYYMTESLTSGNSIWSHNKRYPDFPLRYCPSYIGFFSYLDDTSHMIQGSFPGAHPSAVGLDHNGFLSILSNIQIEKFEVKIGDICFTIHSENLISRQNISLFTPGFSTDKTAEVERLSVQTLGRDSSWQTARHMVPFADNINTFLSNQGDGYKPIEIITALWHGSCPIPSFGSVLSFPPETFTKYFGNTDLFREEFLGKEVKIFIHSKQLSSYKKVYGGFVPAITDGVNNLKGGNFLEVLNNINKKGRIFSPIARSGRESNNFDLFIREPAGLLVQTKEHFGWILFDGRHELSVGVSLIDISFLLDKLSENFFSNEPIEQAFFIDGGSALKVYLTEDGDLKTLNRIAAGGRNGPGSDKQGLNLYSTLSIKR